MYEYICIDLEPTTVELLHSWLYHSTNLAMKTMVPASVRRGMRPKKQGRYAAFRSNLFDVEDDGGEHVMLQAGHAGTRTGSRTATAAHGSSGSKSSKVKSKGSKPYDKQHAASRDDCRAAICTSRSTTSGKQCSSTSKPGEVPNDAFVQPEMNQPRRCSGNPVRLILLIWSVVSSVALLSGIVFMEVCLQFGLLTPSPPASPPPSLPSPDQFLLNPSPQVIPPNLPNPAAPPSPLTKQDFVADLNARFDAGQPSNDLSAAGVLLHTFDALDEGRDDVWNPCPNDAWCGPYNDRWSVSLVNRRSPHFFRGSGKEPGNQPNGGFVINSAVIGMHAVSCAWAIDGGTLGALCDPKGMSPSCTPGCRNGYGCLSLPYEGDYCWWPITQLRAMMEQQARLAPLRANNDTCNEEDCLYNELIVDAAAWADKVPWLIAAVHFPKGSVRGEERARAVYRALLNAFPLLMGPFGPPLVRYNGLSNKPRSNAFTLIS